MKKKAVRYFLVCGFLFSFFLATGQGQIDKNACIKAMASGNVSQIDVLQKQLQKFSGAEKEAYEGALLMRKAETLAVPAKKLVLFKKGHKKLETAILNAPSNTEFRFLRLMVQEHAPKNLGYNKNIMQDAQLIKTNYKSLSAAMQTQISDYSKNSKALKDINN